MIVNHNLANHLRTGTEVDMTTNYRRPSIAHTNGDLLHDLAVWTDACVRMDHDAIRMRNSQPATDLRADWNVGPRHNRPESVPEDLPSAKQGREQPLPSRMVLIGPNASKKRLVGAPFERPLLLATPIRNRCRYSFVHSAQFALDNFMEHMFAPLQHHAPKDVRRSLTPPNPVCTAP
jgi:hypothetical protein